VGRFSQLVANQLSRLKRLLLGRKPPRARSQTAYGLESPSGARAFYNLASMHLEAGRVVPSKAIGPKGYAHLKFLVGRAGASVFDRGDDETPPSNRQRHRGTVDFPKSSAHHRVWASQGEYTDDQSQTEAGVFIALLSKSPLH
jgi:hypothetical protein